MTTGILTRTRHIVVLDNDPDMRRTIGAILEEDGFRVTPTGDGDALLAMLPEHHPDLVILEMVLPGDARSRGPPPIAGAWAGPGHCGQQQELRD